MIRVNDEALRRHIAPTFERRASRRAPGRVFATAMASAATAATAATAVMLLSSLAGCASHARDTSGAEPRYDGTRGAPTSDAQESFVRARRLVGLGRVAEAGHELERLLASAPHFIPAHRLYQDVFSESTRDWEVRRRYGDWLRRAPDDADALYLSARIEPDPDRQSELFDAALAADPAHPWAHVGRALTELRAGDLEAAAGSAFLSSVIDPSLALPWVFLGQMALSRGDSASALEWFDDAIERDPHDARSHLGRAAAAYDLGDRAGAAVAALAALRLAPGDRRVLATIADEVLESAPPLVVREALDVTTTALADVEAPWRVSVLRAHLRLALGDAEGALHEVSLAAQSGAGHAELARVARRAAVRAGHYEAAVRDFIGRAPRELLEPDNLYAERWSRLCRAAADAQRTAGPLPLLALAEALFGVGWRAEARIVLARASASTGPAAAATVRDAGRRMSAATAFDQFIADVGRLGGDLRRASRGGARDVSVADVLARIASASRRRLGRDVTEGAVVRSYPFLGEFAATVTSGGPFAREFDERGLLVLVGHRRGEGARIVVGRIQLVRADATAVVRDRRLTFDECWIETAGLPAELAGLGGGLAGLTIDRLVILQLDTVLRGAAPPTAGLPVLPRPAASELDRLALDTPSAVARRIEADLASEGVLSASMLGAVRRHELGHVLDARQMLPIWSPPWRGAWLALRHGFDGGAVESTLEARAALTALAECDEPRAALASLLAFLPETAGGTAHVRGYLGAVKRLVAIVAQHPDAFVSIDRGQNIVQQLDRLSPAEARELGRRLLAEY